MFIIFGSVLSSFYYLRLIKIMFFDASIYINRFSTFFATKTFLSLYILIVCLIVMFFLTPVLFSSFFDYELLEASLCYSISFLN